MNEEEKLRQIFNRSSMPVSTGEIDEAWNNILPELTALADENKRKKKRIIPYIFMPAFIAISSAMGAFLFKNNTPYHYIHPTAVVVSKPASVRATQATRHLKPTAKTIAISSQNTIHSYNSFKSSHSKLAPNAAILNIVETYPNKNNQPNASVKSTSPEAIMAPIEPIASYVFPVDLRGQYHLFHAESEHLYTGFGAGRRLNERDPRLLPKLDVWQGGAALLYSFNPAAQFASPNNNLIQRLGFASFIQRKIGNDLILGTELNFEPYKTNYYINYKTLYNRKFEQVQLTRVYYFQSMFYASKFIHNNWFVTGGFYYARMLNKYQASRNEVVQDQNGKTLASNSLAPQTTQNVSYFGIRRNDIGFSMGLGKKWNHTEISLRYMQGFVNTLQGTGETYKNSHLSLKLGYYLF